jgi:superfamily II RNA helicase
MSILFIKIDGIKCRLNNNTHNAQRTTHNTEPNMSSSYLHIVNVSTPVASLPPHPYPFSLDPFQQHAISAIAKDENVLVCAKTGSGKTLVGEYQIYHSLKKGKRIFYTTPIKSLSNQKFHDLKVQFKDASVGIMTGDIKFCPNAQIVIMTTEILRNLLYKKGTTTEQIGLTSTLSLDDLDAVIFDECHYINDRDRGSVWEETMILLPPSVRMVMLSATLDHPEYLAEWLGELKQVPIHLIETQYRIVPLTHYVFHAEKEELIPIMDRNEVYHEKKYIDWLKMRQRKEAAADSFQRKVIQSKNAGTKGGVEGKVHVNHFVHQLNEMVRFLQTKELLPALFFVLNRKQCESYAKKIEFPLIDSADTAAVKHMIHFHLHSYMKELEQIQQYHTIYDLLCKGIAFHHSGLLPMLKEIIEILFAKGYVKLLFCTETFAVGLNMPTKTVLFAGLKKYDDSVGEMRMLRTDEYMQMAGRAGRRGKDDKGVVIYLPEREPVEPSEMFQMLKGAKTPITSRMNFHYEFILKTLQSSPSNHPMKWHDIMEKSYWNRLRLQDKKEVEIQILALEKEIQEKRSSDQELYKGCEMRAHWEHLIKTSVNAQRREAQKQLDALKNRQMGPKWNQAWIDYQSLRPLQHELAKSKEMLKTIEGEQQTIQRSIRALYQLGYIAHEDSSTLTCNDLTLKGTLATEINEGHSILLTELYTSNYFEGLTSTEIISLLACFHEQKDSDHAPSLDELAVSLKVRTILYELDKIAIACMEVEIKNETNTGVDNYWDISTVMIEPMTRWMEGESASSICAVYELFEGNFIRTVLKTANMVDELISLATYCQHIEFLNHLMELRQQLVRDIIVSDSLYLHL